jgi:Glycosyl transferase family 2
MPRFKVLIPTRDSARWIGIFLDAYRKVGIEPFYVLDTRSADSTLDILWRKQADLIPFAPSADFAEAGMLEFGARHAGVDWLLRVDDDEFPSRALLRWISSIGARSLNQI